MATTLNEQTVLPRAAATYEALVELLKRERVFVSSDSTDHVLLSAELLRVLRDVAGALHRGEAVTVVPRTTRLTTQQAADLLGISRPTLVKLLEGGEIPFEQPSRHRYLALSDLLAYQDRLRHRRNDLMHGLAHDAAERLDDEPDTFVSTR
jgi:excisionase family DNA binding protein